VRVKKVTAFPQSSSSPNRLRGAAQGYALAKSVAAEGADPVGEQPLVRGKVPKAPKPAAPRGRIFAPQATVDPGDATVRSNAYYGEAQDGVPKEAPIVSVIDADAERPLTKGVLSLGTPLTQECILPRAAAVRSSTSSLFVACLGIDAVVELDTRGSDPMRLERRRWSVPLGPTGVAVDDKHDRAVVWSQFDGKLAVIDLAAGDRPARAISVQYEPAPEVAAIALGRELFHRVDDRRISNDGVACASCHPEGREDAFTWSTPEGPRQTIMLAGRARTTAPYGWQGKHGDLKSYLGNTFSRLGGTGLHQGGPGELEALITYLEKLPGPAVGEAPASAAEIARGKELFFGAAQGCASCHLDGVGIDGSPHDVGSKVTADLEPKFDTPSLRFVRGSGPYFHDGRYPTLRDLLSSPETKMGHTAHLAQRDVAALAAFLETL
jgi:mono/diheme cytochrome c family protein